MVRRNGRWVPQMFFAKDGEGSGAGAGSQGDAGKPDKDKDGKAGSEPPEKADEGKDEDTPKPGETLEQLNERLKKVSDDRKAKNEENKRLKAEAKERDAKLKAYMDAEEAQKNANLSELEKERKAREKLEKEASEAKASAAKSERALHLAQAGVSQKYLDYFDLKLQQALKEKPDLDVTAWMTAQRAEAPAFFGDARVASMSGGPQGGQQNMAKDIEALEKQAASEPDPVKKAEIGFKIHKLKQEARARQ